MIAPSDCPEASLLLRVATTPPVNSTDWGITRNAASPIAWDRLIALAIAENAITVLHSRVKAVPPPQIPSDARDRIERLALVWSFKLRLLERRLIESVAILSDANIEVILLKGAALAFTTYDGFVDRPMADIDLLVDPAKAELAWNLMQQAGWVCNNSEHPVGAWKNHHHLPPLSDTSGSGLRLEIHVAPLPEDNPFQMGFHDVRDASRELSVGCVTVRVPEPHIHAVHACIHFAWSHRFMDGRLNVFRDLAALHGSGTLSWDAVVETARRTRSETCCYWTLRLARALTSLPVPDDVLTKLAPRLSDRLLSVLEHHISQLVLRSDCACPSVGLRERLWALSLQVKRPRRIEPARWTVLPDAKADGALRGPFRRVGAHILRAPQWSRYVASLLPPALEVSS
ncbi:MAG: hypothetical protein JWL97_1321 [Gemmatimonadales bacterium]|nr:hypothetical protein [Gemmatimonadales bacterium]